MGTVEIGFKVNSQEELSRFVSEYEDRNFVQLWTCQSRTISGARKRGIQRTIDERLVYYEITYKCIHGGKWESRSTGIRPRQSSLKLECPFKMRFKVSSDGTYLVLCDLVDEHNHVCTKESYSSLPRQRQLDAPSKNLAKNMLKLLTNKKFVQSELLPSSKSKTTSTSLPQIKNEDADETLQMKEALDSEESSALLQKTPTISHIYEALQSLEEKRKKDASAPAKEMMAAATEVLETIMDIAETDSSNLEQSRSEVDEESPHLEEVEGSHSEESSASVQMASTSSQVLPFSWKRKRRKIASSPSTEMITAVTEVLKTINTVGEKTVVSSFAEFVCLSLKAMPEHIQEEKMFKIHQILLE